MFVMKKFKYEKLCAEKSQNLFSWIILHHSGLNVTSFLFFFTSLWFQCVKQSLTSSAPAQTTKQESLDREAKFFGQLAATKESKALIGLFNGQTECKKNNFGKPERETKLVISERGNGLKFAFWYLYERCIFVLALSIIESSDRKKMS